MLLRRRDVLYAAVGLSACRKAAQSPGETEERFAHTAPDLGWGIQIGDVTATSAVIWARTTRPSQLSVEIEQWRSPKWTDHLPVRDPLAIRASEDNDFTAKTTLRGLEPGGRVKFRVRADDSDWEEGHFVTAPLAPQKLRIAFSGDTNGQGWGIDFERGGMPAYRVLEREEPHLFLHLGDTIYADNPIPPSIDLPDGTTWKNWIDPKDPKGKSHVAETLADYRSAHRYPRFSREVCAASAKVPIVAIWDDHEVRNNWFPGEVITDERYAEKRIDVMAAHARRAMYEYQPTLRSPADPMYRVLRYGPLADIFVLDGRSFRTPNDPPPTPGAMLGPAQEQWLIDALRASRAKWKIVASNMPIGLVIGEPAKQVKWAADGWGNEGTGEPTEREVELARILSAIRGVKNVVWLGADVHYAAAHRFDPQRAAYKDFDPFWELVAGPMHATAFGRKNLDPTFGPELEWCSVDWDTRGSPADGRQYIGVLDIDPARPDLQVRWLDARGNIVHLLAIAAQ